jgi:type II secretory pathway component PulF
MIIKKLFNTLSDDISHGSKISGAMLERDATHTFFTPDIIQMIESAERTSTIGNITDKIAVQYKREVDMALANMVKYIEPVALLLA